MHGMQSIVDTRTSIGTITGCWEGALIPDQGGSATAFAYRQPGREAQAPSGPTFTLGNAEGTPARLLEGTARTVVALVDEARDPASGGAVQLLLEARMRDDRLVGHWLRRDREGRVLASGHLTASRTAG